MRLLLHLLFFSVVAVFTFASSEAMFAKKIRQAHKIEKVTERKNSGGKKKRKVIYVAQDSLLKDSIRFTGYDKPVNTSKETLHVVNNTGHDIRKVGIRVTYLDLNDRMLHSRDTESECNIPCGETRLISVVTWDRQYTFYYYLGPEPRRVATPYKVEISLLWIEY